MSAQILLSTYNGEAFLEAQLDSLLQQDFPSVDILIRDDGSTDGTQTILQRYSASHQNIHVELGNNVGYVSSFFQLLAQSSATARCFAFCDQDDLWNPDKISRAVEVIECRPPQRPIAVCTAVTLVNADLTELGGREEPQRPLLLANALVECPVLGCTLTINPAVRTLLLKATPERAYSHDWWIYLLVSAFGEMVYDPHPSLRYRQHANNRFGAPPSLLNQTPPLQALTLTVRQWQQSLHRFLHDGASQPVMQQVSEFERLYQDALPTAASEELTAFLDSQTSLWHRLTYALRGSAHRQSALNTLIMKLLLVSQRL